VSIEIQAGFPCPHFIIEESVTLGDDRQSLVTSAPVSGAQTVRVLVNNTMYVPSSGLYNQALLQGAPGPYRIERCVGTTGPDGNILTVEASGGTVEIALPEGKRVKLATLKRFLRLSDLNDLVEVTSRNDAIAFGDTQNVGSKSFITVSGDGATALGFEQFGARGSEIYPPWGLVAEESRYPSNTPLGLIPVPARFPRFNGKVRGNPDFKVTYAAMPERCPRCQATYVENDYRFDPTGGVITITNENLLYQACLKGILTRKGSNPYHPGYGSSIMSRIGQKRAALAASQIQEDVINALTRVQSIQAKQRKFQQVTDKERLYAIVTVDVRPHATDPTVFKVNAVVTNGSNRPVRLTVVYTAPGAVALAGSNGQTLGLATSGLTTSQSSRFLMDG